MINEFPQPGADRVGSAFNDDDRRRELELELFKVRAEAEAARLEARAAELELTIRRISRAAVLSREAKPQSFTPSPAGFQPEAAAAISTEPPAAFSSWEAVRAATDLPSPTGEHDAGPARPVSSPRETGAEIVRGQQQQEIAGAASAPVRIDPASAGVARPKLLSLEPAGRESDSDSSHREPDSGDDVPHGGAVIVNETGAGPALLEPADSRRTTTTVAAQAVRLDDAPVGPTQQQRRSPAALLVSTVLHVVILLMLAAFTLRHREPRDQVAISASVSNPSATSMETFQIETSEPEATAPTPSETEYELSPLGELKVAEFSPDAPPAPPALTASDLLSPSQMSAASMALETESHAKIEFCGVEGGGNHFVYLVDSSRSMRDGFESARAELLHSINVLQPHQRFYVVFFDAEPDYMRLGDPNQNESRSVYATDQNKQALKRWAMRITKNDGRATYDPLKFALELKPDVIFLLSDGEFPQGIEDLLKQENRVENLFGDSGPISIVHTIGYHSRQGETRMRRIAEQSKGQYRHVPKP